MLKFERYSVSRNPRDFTTEWFAGNRRREKEPRIGTSITDIILK